MNNPQTLTLAKSYLELLLERKRNRAVDLIMTEVRGGMSIEVAYLEILQPVLYEVGRLWQLNEIDTVVEHYCSAVTQLLMGQLFPFTLSRHPNGWNMIGCCLGSELHEMGLRMVCDLFELDGWDTYFMGAITPGSSLMSQLVKQKPDLVCLSSTMQFGVSSIRDVIAEMRGNSVLNNTRVMVGGLAFMMNPTLAEVVGADGTAVDARTAVQKAREIMAGGR